MIKTFIQFNESKINEFVSFDKGYERMYKGSSDFEHYWNMSKKMNDSDYNSIVKFFERNYPDLSHLVVRQHNTVYINQYRSGVDTLIKRKIDGRIVDVWHLYIWETAYPEENYFNISVQQGDMKPLTPDPIAYYTADTIHGLLNFFKDFFDTTKEI